MRTLLFVRPSITHLVLLELTLLHIEGEFLRFAFTIIHLIFSNVHFFLYQYNASLSSLTLPS